MSQLRVQDATRSWRDAMAQFGGKKYGLGEQAKGPGYYSLTEADLRWAWEWYERGLYVSKIVSHLHRFGKPRLSLKKLVVEWGAIGLPVHEFGRRSKLRDATSQALRRLQDRFDLPTTATMYAALKFAEIQGADLKALVAEDFGQAPKRPRPWNTNRRHSPENVQNEAKPLSVATIADGGEG